MTVASDMIGNRVCKVARQAEDRIQHTAPINPIVGLPDGHEVDRKPVGQVASLNSKQVNDTSPGNSSEESN